MYFVAEAIHNSPLPVSAEELQNVLMPQHVAYVNAAIDRGLVLLGGPKAAGAGGFLLICSENLDEVTKFLANDPMVTSGAQRYSLNQWLIFDKADKLKELF